MCNRLKSGFGAFFRIWRIFLDFRRSRTRNWDLRCSRWAPMSMSTFKSRYFAMSSWNPYFLPQSAHGGRSWQNIRISECSCSWAPTMSTPRSPLSFHSLSQTTMHLMEDHLCLSDDLWFLSKHNGILAGCANYCIWLLAKPKPVCIAQCTI